MASPESREGTSTGGPVGPATEPARYPTATTLPLLPDGNVAAIAGTQAAILDLKSMCPDTTSPLPVSPSINLSQVDGTWEVCGTWYFHKDSLFPCLLGQGTLISGSHGTEDTLEDSLEVAVFTLSLESQGR